MLYIYQVCVRLIQKQKLRKLLCVDRLTLICQGKDFGEEHDEPYKSIINVVPRHVREISMNSKMLGT